jgi:hypothetical protein
MLEKKGKRRTKGSSGLEIWKGRYTGGAKKHIKGIKIPKG